MKLQFIYPRWGSADLEWPVFLSKVKESGYHGVEIDLPLGKERQEITSLLKAFDLNFVGQHWETKEVNFNKHKEQYKKYLYKLAEAAPLLINSHTGMDFFSFAQNAELIELAFDIEKETAIPITHETHRSRFPFAAHVCQLFLIEYPGLKLTADLSHWCCVAESLLENQQEAVELAIQQTYHIHARVGSAQSPQVIDPTDQAYQVEIERFKTWWLAMIENAKKQQRTNITITPEYGPVPYALRHPQTKELLADQWAVNQFIRRELTAAWKE